MRNMSFEDRKGVQLTGSGFVAPTDCSMGMAVGPLSTSQGLSQEAGFWGVNKNGSVTATPLKLITFYVSELIYK